MPDKPHTPPPDDSEENPDATRRFDLPPSEPDDESPSPTEPDFDERTRTIPQEEIDAAGPSGEVEDGDEGDDGKTKVIAREDIQPQPTDLEDHHTPVTSSTVGPYGASEAFDTGEIDSEGVVIDVEEDGHTTKVIARDAAADTEPASPPVFEPEGPTTKIRSEDLAKAPPLAPDTASSAPTASSAATASSAPTQDSDEPTGPVAMPPADTPIEKRDTETSIRDAKGAAPVQASPRQATPTTEVAKEVLKYDPLPGEVDEVPPERPFSLRPETTDENSDAGARSAPKTSRTRALYLPWVAVGCVMGLVTFAFAYLSPGPQSEYPFAPVELSKRSVDAIPALSEDVDWTRNGDAYFAFTEEPAAIHVYKTGEDAGEYIGSAPLKEDQQPASTPTLVGMPALEGYVVAWTDDLGIHWRQVQPADPSGAALPLGDPVRPVNIALRPDEHVIGSPVRVIDWNGERPQRTALAIRSGDENLVQVFALDGTRVKTIRIEGSRRERLIAAPVSEFIAATETSLLLIATTHRVIVLDINASGSSLTLTKDEGEPIKPRFDEDYLTVIRRARFGKDRRGWIVAQADGFAAVALDGDNSPALVARETWDAPAGEDDDDEDDKAPATVHAISFANATSPERDDFIVASGGSAWWIDLGTGSVSIDPIEVPSANIAAADLNGDLRPDLIGPDAKGGVWVVDGATKRRVQGGVTGSGDPPAGELTWRRGENFIEAFYFTKENLPVRIRIAIQSGSNEDLAPSLRRDAAWRDGQGPL